MGISSRHHYLPVFYLKGFTDAQGLLNVYNIKEDRLVNKSLPPKSVFFERDRNTLFLEPENTDFIEQLYSMIDSSCAKAFESLLAIKNKEVTTDILIKVRFFISTLFWRIPNIDSDIDAFIDGLGMEDLKFKIVDKEGKDAPPDVFQKYLQDPNFRKAYRASLSLINHRIIKNDEVNNWKFYFATDRSFHVCGDSPIIKRDESAKFLEDTDFIIPLSSRNLLIHKKGERVNVIQPETIFKIDLLIFLQSSKYACCLNRGYLEALSKMRAGYTESRMNYLKQELFSTI